MLRVQAPSADMSRDRTPNARAGQDRQIRGWVRELVAGGPFEKHREGLVCVI
ncbi:MAG: hypothetical protein KatS3mg081_0006 [Gemmatimonadales bacterium]|nr:MAG: hypothetical protein KatS3mg081_0006 [Gemmatimonadales bacterium]